MPEDLINLAQTWISIVFGSWQKLQWSDFPGILINSYGNKCSILRCFTLCCNFQECKLNVNVKLFYGYGCTVCNNFKTPVEL